MQKAIKLVMLVLVFFTFLSACDLSAGEGTNSDREAKTEDGVNAKAAANVKQIDPALLPKLHDEFKRIHERGKLVVAMYSEDRFPFFFLNEQGELVGSDVEMAYDIAYQLGLTEVEFNRTAKSYDELIDLVASSQVDLAIAKISITLNRAQRVLFSEPYLSLKQALLVNRMHYAQLKTKEMADPVQVLEANPVKIGAVAGTSYIEFAQELFPSAEIVPFETKEKMFEAAQRGDIAAAFYDEFELKRYVNDRPDALLDLQLVVVEDRKDDLAIAVPPEHLRMQAWLKQYFAYRSPLDIDQVLVQYSSNQQAKSAN